jgi:toxin ParE1/3/4
MTVGWTSNAKRELRAIHDYIAQNSPRYAQGMVDRVTLRTKELAQFPRLGAVVPEYEDESIQELFEHPYRIIYQAHTDRVVILTVVHGSRQLPRGTPGTT